MKTRSRTTTRLSTTARGTGVLGLSLVLAGLLAGGAVAASGPQFTPGNAESELIRLINGERAANGAPPLVVDPFLQWVARDGPVDCPNGGETMEGRAKDMAVHDFFSHDLRTCGIKPGTTGLYSIIDAMHNWGYSIVGENAAMDGGFAYTATTYQFGCDVDHANCTGGTTQAPSTVATAAYGWMGSPGHRFNILTTAYARFGCGAWELPAPDSYHYYVCMFAYGPGTREAPAPTPTPVATPTPDPTPTPEPTPDPTPEPTPAWDETAPLVTSLTAPIVATARNRSFTSAWSATDNDGVSEYVTGIRKGSGMWKEQPAQTGTTRTFSGLSPGTWHVGVRAVDAAGNWSDFRQRTVLVPTDDRAWRFSRGTIRRTDGRFVNGTDTTTRRTGARMTIRFTGSSFVLLGTTAANHGKLRVTIDGRSYIVDEGYHLGARATSTHYRVTLLNRSLTRRAHTVVITNLGTAGRPTIDVDGAAWQN